MWHRAQFNFAALNVIILRGVVFATDDFLAGGSYQEPLLLQLQTIFPTIIDECEIIRTLGDSDDDEDDDDEETARCSQRFWASPVARGDDAGGLLVTSQGPPKAASKPVRRARLVAKDGNCRLKQIHLPNRYKNLYKNWFHLVIESSWRCILILFAVGFLASWTTFAVLYYAIVYLSGDLQKNPENRQCIANVHSFVTAFLFSLESQHTIGYGTRFMTDMCPPAFIVLCVQLIFGVLLQTMLAGIVIAKVLRPKKRKQEMKFSRFAVIGPVDEHDKRPALMIRVADIQDKLYLAESHVRLYMARTRVNERNERELVGVKDMNVGYDSGLDRVLLLWPIIVRHVIDEESPLWGMGREHMMRGEFELIMTVEGIVEATGMTFQARTSFLPDEIQWGYKFRPMVLLSADRRQYEVHYERFEEIESCDEFVPDVTAVEEVEDDHPLLNASGAFPVFKVAKWSFTNPVAVEFYLKAVDGRWKYGFTNPDYDRRLHTPDSQVLTASELVKRSDLKRIRVGKVEIYEWSFHYHPFVKSLDVDLEKLLKFTSCLMDEPELVRLTHGPEVFENTAPDGAVIRKWLEEEWFREIYIHCFTAADQSLLDKRRKDGKPLEVMLSEVNGDEEGVILQDYLMVMETIIENFRRNPEDYTRKSLYIHAKFDETTNGMLEEMRENGLCHFKGRKYVHSWVFEAGKKSLSVNYFLRSNNNRYGVEVESEERS